MKTLFYSFFCLSLVLVACKKDDDCNEDSLESAIVGDWSLFVDDVDYGNVEFESDGTLVDPDSLLINPDGGTGEVFDILTYEVHNNSAFSAYADNAAMQTQLFVDYDVESFTYDEIVLDGFSVDVRLKRN